MTRPAWHEEPVTRQHDRTAFDCGDADLNDFLVRYARQSHDLGAAKTFLAIDDATRSILGFYSLAPVSLAHQRAPAAARRGLPRHEIPGFRLARLAVAQTRQGRGLGGQLLLAAGRRCLTVATLVGGTILVIDAKSDRAATWYASYGAIPLLDAPRTLVLPLATIASALRDLGKLPP
jgi:GNAT superfamily N-acetyltransferase